MDVVREVASIISIDQIRSICRQGEMGSKVPKMLWTSYLVAPGQRKEGERTTNENAAICIAAAESERGGGGYKC